MNLPDGYLRDWSTSGAGGSLTIDRPHHNHAPARTRAGSSTPPKRTGATTPTTITTPARPTTIGASAPARPPAPAPVAAPVRAVTPTPKPPAPTPSEITAGAGMRDALGRPVQAGARFFPGAGAARTPEEAWEQDAALRANWTKGCPVKPREAYLCYAAQCLKDGDSLATTPFGAIDDLTAHEQRARDAVMAAPGLRMPKGVRPLPGLSSDPIEAWRASAELRRVWNDSRAAFLGFARASVASGDDWRCDPRANGA